MDFSKIKVNCSMLGVVMAEPKGVLTEAMFETLEKLKAKEELTYKQELKRIELQFRMDNYDPKKLSGGCMKYLLFLYCYHRYGPQFRPQGNGGVAGMEKGKKSERSSFEMVRRVTGRDLYRSKGNIKNDFLKGRMDVINAPTLEAADTIIDIKGHHGWMDFMPSIAKEEISSRDNFQMQGYMGVTGKDYGEVFRVLSDFTEDDIEKQKDKLVRELCPDGVLTDEFEEEWYMTENAMRFSKIPEEERITYFHTERDEKIIDKIYEKVEFCREWLSEFEQKHINKVAGQRLIWQTLIS